MTAVILTATAVAAYAQDDLVKEAQKLADKGDYEGAITTIKPALSSDATTDKAAAWNAYSDFHYQNILKINQVEAANKEIEKDPKSKKTVTPFDTLGRNISMMETVAAAMKCDYYDRQPDEKGKVKPRYRAANRERFFQNGRIYLVAAGQYLYEHKDNETARKAWKMYVDSAEDSLFAGTVIADDPYYTDIAYYTGLLSYQAKEYDDAVKYATIAMQDPDKATDAGEIILFSQKETCKTKEDSLKYLSTLKTLHKNNPTTEKYFNLLMNYYQTSGDQEAMNAWVNEEVTVDPTNKMVWALKGEAEMNTSKWDDAIESYKKAAEIDPEFVQVVFNIGACYNSKAIELKEQLADKKTGGLTTENADKVKSVLTDAKTYMERSKELDPNREKVNWAYPLYQIYYNLGEKEKSAEMEALLETK